MIKLAIDLGSSVTKIFRADAGYGIVLAEPSCVAVGGSMREIRAVGKDAKKLVGKTAEFTEIVFPVYEGEIVDERLASEMLKKFLSKIDIPSSQLKRAKILFSVPCGASEETKETYSYIAEECGLKGVKFVETPYLAALGSDAVLSVSDPVFTIDIGGGSTNIAAVSLCGIIAGLSMNIGGNNIDANIMDKMEQVKGLNVGFLTAERIKNEVGSLSKQSKAATVAEGSSVSSRKPSSVSVQSGEIYDCISVYVDKIIEYASLVLKQLPAEVSASVNQNGIYLSGGVSRIDRIADYISEKLEMRVHVCDEPQFAVITGAGSVARDDELLKILTTKNDD